MNEEFIRMIESEKSPLFDGLFSALKKSPPTSVRLNPAKASIYEPEWAEHSEKVAWENMGRYLDERPNFTLDPCLHQGLYYVQEASSMIYGEIIRRIAVMEKGIPMRVLDSCAAPGGKTTSVLASLPDNSAVIANEFDYKRAEILRENLEKWGYPNVAITRGSTEQFSRLNGTFDIVIVDAPCSGEGMFRKSETAVTQWSRDLVNQCSVVQKDIVKNVYPSLSTGGYLIYSTCTFNPEENEKNIKHFCTNLDLTPVNLDWSEKWGICKGIGGEEGCYRFLPHKTKGEGLFVAIMKKGGKLRIHETESRPNLRHKSVSESEWSKGLLIEKKDTAIWGTTPLLASLISELERKRINLFTRGSQIAVIKGKDYIPTQALALSIALNETAFPIIEVSEDVALEYLRKHPIEVSPNLPKGYILLKYNNLPLGFINNLGKRTNNLLPKEWRIRI